MKKIISKYKGWFACILLLTAGMLTHQYVFPQIKIGKPKPCGKYTIDATSLKAVKDFESANAYRLSATSFSVRVYFHIFRNDDGTNAGATAAQIESEFNQLVADYAPNNICFINMGFNYINNTQVNTNLNSDIPSNVAWLNPYLVPGCINIFYHANLLYYGGNAFAIPNTFCSVDRNNIGAGQTISHEVGHCFGLLHTFETYSGLENINGSNSTTTGDLVTDTPADPYAYNGSACFSSSSCCYTGYCTDPNGQSGFSPPYNNMMAYWWVYGYTNLTITPAQYTRLNSYLLFISSLQNCESPAYTTLGPVTFTSGYNMFSAVNTLTTSGSVNLGGSTVTTLGGSLVLLEPGFNANSSGGANILIRPSACVAGAHRIDSPADSKIISAISAVPETNSKVFETNSNYLKCYPNPFSRSLTVEFSLAKDGDASINLYDLAGKVLQPGVKSFYTKGTHRVTVDAPGLPAGMYMIVIQTPAFRKEQKIIKVN